MTEQSLLKLSIVVTILVAAFGVCTGVISGSSAITFDGVYSLADAFMTVLALLVSKLIAASATSVANGKIIGRFSVGFWHLEPMVLGLNGTLLMGAAGVALVGAIGSLMDGGNLVDFGPALIFASLTTVTSLSAGLLLRNANKKLQSAFVDLDSKAWLMTAGLTAALLIAFAVGYLVKGTSYEWVSPLVDPAILALVCLFILPTPISNVRQAVADILLIAPEELRTRVENIGQEIVDKYRFTSYRAYVAKVGRAKQVEMFFIAPPDMPTKSLAEWDAIRNEIGILIGGEGPDRWLTIVFTGDLEWAE
jgi:predicted Co/Zn/Cd cation transporter (cation efflux family)